MPIKLISVTAFVPNLATATENYNRPPKQKWEDSYKCFYRVYKKC